MNASRLRQLEEGSTTTARKVLEAVPRRDAWTPHEIFSELMRLNGTAPAIHIVHGCLRRLSEDGIIKEHKGTYTRITVRSVPAATEGTSMPTESIVKAVPAPTPRATPVDRISALSTQLREMGGKLCKIADEIDDAAVDLASEVEQSSGAARRLAQLRELLQG
jgi:hypothetical protein